MQELKCKKCETKLNVPKYRKINIPDGINCPVCGGVMRTALEARSLPKPKQQPQKKAEGTTITVSNLNIKVELQQTDIFKSILNVISNISKDERIHGVIREEYILAINSIINSEE